MRGRSAISIVVRPAKRGDAGSGAMSLQVESEILPIEQKPASGFCSKQRGPSKERTARPLRVFESPCPISLSRSRWAGDDPFDPASCTGPEADASFVANIGKVAFKSYRLKFRTHTCEVG